MDDEYEEQNYEIKEDKLIIGNNNPWTVSSLYQFQYFCCPSCIFRVDRWFSVTRFDYNGA